MTTVRGCSSTVSSCSTRGSLLPGGQTGEELLGVCLDGQRSHRSSSSTTRRGGGAKLILDYENTTVPDTTAPEAPTALETEAAEDSIFVRWDASTSTDVVGYNVYRSLTTGVTASAGNKLNVAPLNVVEFEDIIVDGETTYYYVVTAVDGAGNESVVSGEVSGTTITADTTPPVAPTLVVAGASETQISVVWLTSASNDVVGYNIYRGTATGVTPATGTKLNTSGLNATNGFIDTTAVAGTPYFYVVTAVDAAGNESAASPQATATIPSIEDTEAPAAPTALVVTGGDAQVSLEWTASVSGDVDGYAVYRAIEPGALTNGDLVSGPNLVAGTTFVDTTVSNGTTYFYQVLALDGSDNASTPSNEVLVTPRPVNDTEIFVDFTATNAVPVAGYVADWGQAYGPRSSAGQGTGLTYGWVDSDGHELSLVTQRS